MSIANKTVSFPCVELRDHTRLHMPLSMPRPLASPEAWKTSRLKALRQVVFINALTLLHPCPGPLKSLITPPGPVVLYAISQLCHRTSRWTEGCHSVRHFGQLQDEMYYPVRLIVSILLALQTYIDIYVFLS